MRITYERLVKAGACEEQRELFRRLYPRGLQPTVENLALARAEGLLVFWACRLLPSDWSDRDRLHREDWDAQYHAWEREVLNEQDSYAVVQDACLACLADLLERAP